MITIADTQTLLTIVAVTCGECGIAFGLEERYQSARVNDHRTFYCPNGHPRAYFGKTAAEKLREQLKNAQALTEFERERKEEWRRSAVAQKGQVTKLKNRIKNGVCPCCNRTFQNLSRHMAGQHPDFAESA